MINRVMLVGKVVKLEKVKAGDYTILNGLLSMTNDKGEKLIIPISIFSPRDQKEIQRFDKPTVAIEGRLHAEKMETKDGTSFYAIRPIRVSSIHVLSGTPKADAVEDDEFEEDEPKPKKAVKKGQISEDEDEGAPF